MKNTLDMSLLKNIIKCGVVYSLKCDTYDEEYVGKTGRLLSMRMKGHKSSILNKNM